MYGKLQKRVSFSIIKCYFVWSSLIDKNQNFEGDYVYRLIQEEGILLISLLINNSTGFISKESEIKKNIFRLILCEPFSIR